MVMNPWAVWTGCATSCCCTSAVALTPIPTTIQQSDRGAPWSRMLTMFQANAEVRAAGMVINTMGWVDVLGYELLLHSIATLRADVVLVVGQDRLYSQLSSELRYGRISTLLLALPCVYLSSCWLLFRSGCDDLLSSKLQCTLCGQLGTKRAAKSACCGGVCRLLVCTSQPLLLRNPNARKKDASVVQLPNSRNIVNGCHLVP